METTTGRTAVGCKAGTNECQNKDLWGGVPILFELCLQKEMIPEETQDVSLRKQKLNKHYKAETRRRDHRTHVGPLLDEQPRSTAEDRPHKENTAFCLMMAAVQTVPCG